MYRITHPLLTPIHSRLRGRHRILHTPQREKLITFATSLAGNCCKSYTKIAHMAGITACKHTLRCTMSSAGYYHRVARKKPYLSSKTRQAISKNYILRPVRPMHLTHRTPKTQTSTPDVTSIRCRIRNIFFAFSRVLTSSGHGPLHPERPDDVR